MNSFENLQSSFYQFLQQQFALTPEQLSHCSFELNTDSDKQQFGHINSNVAMVCSKIIGQPPRELAQQIVNQFSDSMVEKIEIAGPGFLNFFVTDAWFTQLAKHLQTDGKQFFASVNQPKEKINIEFVSANPTGPMHVGHGRNGILGDVLANVLSFIGNDVSKEFYINDAGAQITKLGNSFKIRCLQELGQDIELPEDAYHGDYLITSAKECVQQYGVGLEQKSIEFFQEYAKQQMLTQLKRTLHEYGIDFDTWFSEKVLHDQGKVEQAIERLVASGYTYEKDSALWFKSTEFGDDKDRVLQKANTDLTYVAADVAYLIDKFDRGYEQLIMVLGHDHHSYKIRLHAIMQALGYDPAKLHIILYQLVHIVKDGKPVKMSKRSGTMSTLHEVTHAVGKNVARFFFLNRKADAELEFDIDLALQQSNENPIYYIEYAFVRTHSIERKAIENQYKFSQLAPFDQPMTELEKLLLTKVCSLKTLITNISHNYQTHLIAYYSYELAHLFHRYYNTSKILDPSDTTTTHQRLALVKTIQQAIAVCFELMGITPRTKM